MFDGSSKEDKQLTKSLIFFHGLALYFIELYGEEIEVVFNIGSIEGGIVVDFHADLF